jgi:hypothetical protein
MTRLVMSSLLAVFLAVWTGCSTTSVRRYDGELRALSEAGKAAYEQGGAAKAATLYEQAYRRGMLIDEPMEAGRSAYNAALCHLSMCALADATKLLGEARRLLISDANAMMQVDMADAELELRRGNRKAAGDLARRVLAGRGSAPLRCQAAVLLAEMALVDQDGVGALSWYKVARATGSDNINPILAARREGVGAQLIHDGIRKGDEGEQYLVQARYCRDGGAYGDMAAALMKAGDAFKAVGRFPEAFAAYERAVNSFVVLGDKVSAANAAVQAGVVVSRLDDMIYGNRIRLLRNVVGQ